MLAMGAYKTGSCETRIMRGLYAFQKVQYDTSREAGIPNATISSIKKQSNSTTIDMANASLRAYLPSRF